MHENTLSRKEEVGILIPLMSVSLESELPLAKIFLPLGHADFRVQLHISIKIPLASRSSDVVLYLGTTGVETTPIWIRIEGEGLRDSVACPAATLLPTNIDMRGNVTLYARIGIDQPRAANVSARFVYSVVNNVL